MKNRNKLKQKPLSATMKNRNKLKVKTKREIEIEKLKANSKRASSAVFKPGKIGKALSRAVKKTGPKKKLKK